jgi:hypothetical protein
MTATLTAEAVGPVDVAVVLFEGNRFNGDVAPAIAELQENGTVRIVDLIFVSKDADGAVLGVEVADSELADQFAEIVEDHQWDLLSADDIERIGENMEPETSALVVVWENVWAARLGGALRASRGQVLSLERVPHDVVARAVADLEGN